MNMQKKIVFIDIENCPKFQLPGTPEDYVAIFIVCKEGVEYPILDQVNGLDNAFVKKYKVSVPDKADGLLLDLMNQSLDLIEKMGLLSFCFELITNDKKFRGKARSLCHKRCVQIKCSNFFSYENYIGPLIHEITKVKKRFRPQGRLELISLLTDFLEDHEIYHLEPHVMLKKMDSKDIVHVRGNFVTYNV
ncbi:hypothetical protein L1267_17990 [Pseudoalteromonas sp. OFAV1]|uniref:hypothetical protein n=1 Tax=Pseudoalteromonas sp. OFAV1 TaxID=2908892 RepID=UPI001F492BCF|nr:hypothetical protein [Pseudoalteromonas sp. OFAV1]MCF2902264.1 hypothetical protein [Pseudoalteromonas sp. OFAV1]